MCEARPRALPVISVRLDLHFRVCPKQGKRAALILPACNTEAMNLHLAEIAKAVAAGAHGRCPCRNDRLPWGRALDIECLPSPSHLRLPTGDCAVTCDGIGTTVERTRIKMLASQGRRGASDVLQTGRCYWLIQGQRNRSADRGELLSSQAFGS
jgi:hypothetical protein